MAKRDFSVVGSLFLDSLLAVQELNRRSLKVSSGVEKIKQAGNSFYFEWTGAKLDVRLESTSNPFVAKLEIKRTN